MKVSEYLLPTLRSAPAEATLKSHELMLRAGLIQKVASGLYNYLPLGLRAFKKVENIIREEMNRSGALEAVMPILVPQSLLLKSGRWNLFKEELFRLKDRSNAALALSPTNEENFTQLVTETIHSYKQLPITLYQIEKKFRDEIRPRYGVMRGKQFTMKDAYSFHQDAQSLEQTYITMREAYKRIFTRLDFDFVHVAASSGAMGGSHSEEFIVKSHIGEERIVICPKCHYAANIETAEETLHAHPTLKTSTPCPPLKSVPTPNANTIEKVCAFLKTDQRLSIKTLLYEVVVPPKPSNQQANHQNHQDHQEPTPQAQTQAESFTPVIVIIRGDYEVSPLKLEQALEQTFGSTAVRLASLETIEAVFQCEKGYLAPIHLAKPVHVLADVSLNALKEGVAGANQKDTHFIHVDIDRDIKKPLLAAGDEYYQEVAIYQVNENGTCPNCGHALTILKGIEVGHIFALGDKYCKALELTVLSAAGTPLTPLMGCYGIGVDRCLAAVIETHHDENGIVFPLAIAPFSVVLITIGKLHLTESGRAATKHSELYDISHQFYQTLTAKGIEVLWDDREERAGVKFKDADLIGIPIQLVLSDTLIKAKPEAHCEVQFRHNENLASQQVSSGSQKSPEPQKTAQETTQTTAEMTANMKTQAAAHTPTKRETMTLTAAIRTIETFLAEQTT